MNVQSNLIWRFNKSPNTSMHRTYLMNSWKRAANFSADPTHPVHKLLRILPLRWSTTIPCILLFCNNKVYLHIYKEEKNPFYFTFFYTFTFKSLNSEHSKTQVKLLVCVYLENKADSDDQHKKLSIILYKCYWRHVTVQASPTNQIRLICHLSSVIKPIYRQVWLFYITVKQQFFAYWLSCLISSQTNGKKKRGNPQKEIITKSNVILAYPKQF